MKKIMLWILCIALIPAFLTATQVADRNEIAPQQLEKKDAVEPVFPAVRRSTGGPDDFGYRWIDSNEPGGPVFSWIDISATGTATNIGDDAVFWGVPFNFTFYGMEFDTVGIGSNGALIFRNVYWTLSNYALPTSSPSTDTFIALYWDDLNPASTYSDDVYYQVMGPRLVVQWNNIVHYGGSDTLMIEIILDRSNGDIIMQYLRPSLEAGSGGTVGIQGSPVATPAWYLQYLYNQTLLTPNLAIKFYLPPAEIVWDFETGWQGWTHTNGLAFPAGWDVQVDDYQTGFSPPDPGDSTMWIDSDADGGAHWIQDTALSPVVEPQDNMTWLKYGYCNADDGSATYQNELRVGLRYFTGSAWNTVELAAYPPNVVSGPDWGQVDVSTYATADSVRVYFYFNDFNTWGYWASFDNVGLYPPDNHDVGCAAVVSPPAGPIGAGTYNVSGQIMNYGDFTETFDVTATVYDTTAGAPWTVVFDQTVTLTDFPIAGDSTVNFGSYAFGSSSYFYTEIYTELSGDTDPSNDTSSIFSRTALVLGDVIFISDSLPVWTGQVGHYGIEFDGTYFYLSTAYSTPQPNAICVVDTLGNLLWAVPNGTSTTYGMRDLAWDGVYAGPDRIDTLWASDDVGNYKFGINLATGTFNSYGSFSGPPITVCRALAWDDDDEWFFTANWSPLYKFSKTNPNIQSTTGPTSIYGAAYDTDDLEGGYVWWFGQTGTYSAHLTQMNPVDMTMTGLQLDIPHTVSGGIAGGLCFYEGFRNMDVLFGIIQTSRIYGVFIREHVTGVAEQPGDVKPVFGFAPSMATVNKGHLPIAYTTTAPGHVSLKVYDGSGRLVQTLVNAYQPAGTQSLIWNNKDMHNRAIANGVYFLKLEAEDGTAVHKLVVVK